MTKSASGHVTPFFLHPVGFVGHIVHFGASVHEMSMHYFSSSGGTCTDMTKSVSGDVMLY
jgi:hypothetical protein